MEDGADSRRAPVSEIGREAVESMGASQAGAPALRAPAGRGSGRAAPRGRSTKAGVRIPATRAPGVFVVGVDPFAQRRPGFESRRHPPGHRRGHEDPVRRSTKAGVRIPATHLHAGRRDGRGEDRSTKAGVRIPATPAEHRMLLDPEVGAQRRPGFESRRHRRTSAWSSIPRTTLNEGRGSNPGDTLAAAVQPRLAPRSTKAGVRIPATRHGPERCAVPVPPLNEGRGSNPGDTVGSSRIAAATVRAQRRPGFESRRHRVQFRFRDDHVVRSTKAGVRIPATPRRDTPCPALSRPLNEGRGSNPGDTANPINKALSGRFVEVCRSQWPAALTLRPISTHDPPRPAPKRSNHRRFARRIRVPKADRVCATPDFGQGGA